MYLAFFLLVNSNSVVQLYDGIVVPLANVITSTVNVSPTSVLPSFRTFAVRLSNVPAADSQLIDAEDQAPCSSWSLSWRRRYVILHLSVTFCPRIGGPSGPHTGFGSETQQLPNYITPTANNRCGTYINFIKQW